MAAEVLAKSTVMEEHGTRLAYCKIVDHDSGRDLPVLALRTAAFRLSYKPYTEHSGRVLLPYLIVSMR